MLIFNGKKYFVPLFTVAGGETSGADALPSQVVDGAKFVGKNGILETGTMPIYDGEILTAERNENIDDDSGYGFYIYPGYNDYLVQDEMYFRVPKSELITGEIEEVDELPTRGSIRNNLLYLYRNKYYKRKETNAWVFNDVITVPEEMLGKDYHFSFSVVLPNGGVMTMDTMNLYYDTDLFISFYAEDGSSIEDAYEGQKGWLHENYKTITINEMPNDATFLAWLNENATVIGNWEEYAETTANSDYGETWVFNSELTQVIDDGFVDVQCSGYMLYDKIDEPFNFHFSTIRFYRDEVNLINADGVEISIYYIDNFLYNFRHATITFTELPNNAGFIAWLKENATKRSGSDGSILVASSFDNTGDGIPEVYSFYKELPERFSSADIHIDAVRDITDENGIPQPAGRDSHYIKYDDGTMPAHVYCLDNSSQYLYYWFELEKEGIYELAAHLRIKDAQLRGATYTINKGTEYEHVFVTTYGWGSDDEVLAVRNNDQLQGAYMSGMKVHLKEGANTIHITPAVGVTKNQHFRNLYLVKTADLCKHDLTMDEAESMGVGLAKGGKLPDYYYIKVTFNNGAPRASDGFCRVTTSNGHKMSIQKITLGEGQTMPLDGSTVVLRGKIGCVNSTVNGSIGQEARIFNATLL